MSTLTYTDGALAGAETAEAKPARKSILARLYDAIVESQKRRAEREIARYMASRGPLTDELEREIMRRLTGSRAFK
jgi:precorrin-6x reductase